LVKHGDSSRKYVITEEKRKSTKKWRSEDESNIEDVNDRKTYAEFVDEESKNYNEFLDEGSKGVEKTITEKEESCGKWELLRKGIKRNFSVRHGDG